MKPMLKKDFFAAVESLLTNGFKPTFYTVDNGKIGILSFTDKNGSKQVEQVYSCTYLGANTIATRFLSWFTQAIELHFKNESTPSDSAAEEPEDILPLGDEAGEIVLEVETMISVKQRYPMEFAVVGHHVFVGAIRTDFEYDKNFYFGVNLKETVIGREVFLRVPELEPSFFTENASAFKMQAQREIIILPDRDFSPIGGTKALQRDILGSASRCHTAATPTIMRVDHE